MTTTVRLNDQLKREIENLPAQILINQHRKLTQQAALNYLTIKPAIQKLDMTLLMLSLNCTQSAFQFISKANLKIISTMAETQFLFKFGLIDEETELMLLSKLDLSHVLLEAILINYN